MIDPHNENMFEILFYCYGLSEEQLIYFKVAIPSMGVIHTNIS